MGETGQEKRESTLANDTAGELREDPFELLLREIAHDSCPFSEISQPVSILPVEGEIIGGRFKIGKCLGTGGMGTVYYATHVLTLKPVAIKWMLPAQSIKPEAVRRFIREAQAAGRIDHPNVVDVYDFGKHKSGYYLVMKLLHGEPLSAHLKSNYAYPYAEAIELLMPAMRGVAAAHAAGVIHRDLKPANIFLCKGFDGIAREPKVLDFGISKLLPQPGQNEQFQTTDSVFVGTPSYAAPECLRASKTIDRRADVYSLGVILYELMAGRPPYIAQNFCDLLIEITTAKADPLNKHRPKIPAELSDIVMKAMAREPDQRFSDVRSLAIALEPFTKSARFESARIAAARSSSSFTAIKQKSSVRLWIITSLIVTLITMAGLWVAPEKATSAFYPTCVWLDSLTIF